MGMKELQENQEQWKKARLKEKYAIRIRISSELKLGSQVLVNNFIGLK